MTDTKKHSRISEHYRERTEIEEMERRLGIDGYIPYQDSESIIVGSTTGYIDIPEYDTRMAKAAKLNDDEEDEEPEAYEGENQFKRDLYMKLSKNGKLF